MLRLDVIQRYSRISLAVALICAAIGCTASSPVAPKVIDVTGVWTGTLPFRMPDEDWSLARVSLVQAGDSVAGEITSRDDVRYPLSGTLSATAATLSVDGLPGNSTCSDIQLLVTRFDFRGPRVQRLSGRATGRCYGTVAGEFELRRID